MENATGPGENKLRPIRKKEQTFLKRELEHWRWLNLLDDEQASAISVLYGPAKERCLQVFMGLGAMLVRLRLHFPRVSLLGSFFDNDRKAFKIMLAYNTTSILWEALADNKHGGLL